jgi:carboxylate-amine ligase
MIDLDPESLRTAFEGGGATVGIEEELMLLDPGTLDLAPVAGELLARLDGDPRFKGELPAAQIELITAPCVTVGEAAAQLSAGRERLIDATAGRALAAAAGVHPFASAKAELSDDPRYAFTRREYAPVASRQLVFGLHVHVRVSGAERALSVYNALRSYLPTLAALAANAPFHEGADSGFASIRPQLSDLLPRQGIPPAFATLDQWAAALAFGRVSGTYETGAWWWELRLHPVQGTVEVRVPDQQATVGETAAVAAVVHCLVVHLQEAIDAGSALPGHPSWAIRENRWLAARHGLAGDLLDLDTGQRMPAREVVIGLVESLAPVAGRLGCQAELEAAAGLARRNGSERQLQAGSPEAATEELAALFLVQG